MYTLDYKEYADKIRQTVAESVVLLKNEDGILPIKQEESVAIFGRAQIETYYCGTGSGGMVNIPYLADIAAGIRAKRMIDEELYNLHVDYIEKHPFDKGKGWAQEPFSQKEFPINEEIVCKASEKSDTAIFVIGRSAGEDKDCLPEEGSYYLSEVEKCNLKLVCEGFKKVVVVLNIGTIMDLSYINECNPSAILIAWHGGVESGNGYADVICGDVNACGCLTDTVAYNLDDYPSTKNYGGESENVYEEDIFVGYRYFETLAPQKVMYPFGYGLSYTAFSLDDTAIKINGDELLVECSVANTGKLSGKKTVQLYVNAPIGKLGKAKYSLCGFSKTKELAPGEIQKLIFKVEKKDIASFDESKSAFVLEQGKYSFYVGFDVRDVVKAGIMDLKQDEVVQTCTPALLPIKPFKKLVVSDEYTPSYEDALSRDYKICERIAQQTQLEVIKTNFGYTYDDLKAGKITAAELANDMSDIELIQMARGEGMCSPKVTAGTAGCFGGVSSSVKDKRKMPVVCCADGPSGIRMDCGTMAISMPNATALASTFNTELIEELFKYLAIEMLFHKVDTILGPGMNIHRNPLCGRNFEYFSEDPYLTGKMAVTEIKTLNRYAVTGTVKHFACNNQEKARKTVDAVVSARALREIYLKGFEMAVKEGGAFSLMTAYNPVNGTQAASNYDLNTVILRQDWGYEGVVMTDWWATMNTEGEEASERHTAQMITSGNNVFMVCADSERNTMDDNSEEELKKGNLSRYSLVKSGEEMLGAMLKYNCSLGWSEVKLENIPQSVYTKVNEMGDYVIEGNTEIDCTRVITEKKTVNTAVLSLSEMGRYLFTFELFADAPPLAQIPMTLKKNGEIVEVFTLKGGTERKCVCEVGIETSVNAYIELFFGESGMELKSFSIKKIGEQYAS